MSPAKERYVLDLPHHILICGGDSSLSHNEHFWSELNMKFRYEKAGVRLLSGVVWAFLLIATLTNNPLVQAQSSRPCDIYAPNTPCVAAFSTTRALYNSYIGPLYQVTRKSNGDTTDIGLTSDGYADGSAQDDFCSGYTCTITVLYDQTSNHNDLTVAPPGSAGPGPSQNGDGYDVPAIADAAPIVVNGHNVYGLFITPGMGYRRDLVYGTAQNGAPEGVYMVASGTHVAGDCCFDFGNAETTNNDDGIGRMDALNVSCYGNPCTPHVNMDLEDGIFGDLQTDSNLPFITAMGTSDGQQSFAVYWGNAQSGSLNTPGYVPLPPGYSPLNQEGAIILGIGGDNSNRSAGTFFEGVMTIGAPSGDDMQAVQDNIVAAGYSGGA